MTLSATASANLCARCGTELAPTLLACPARGRLAHADRLNALAEEARAAAAGGERVDELARWREALDLLPVGSRQREVVAGKVDALSAEVHRGGGTSGPAAPASRTDGRAGVKGMLIGLGALGLLLWKLKFAVAFVVTKGKLLLLGLTKASTLFSMLLSLGVYWAAWGWKFALGVVLSIYVHEMGHVLALRRYGFKASAPMFIPGLGAVIRLRQHPANPREDAAVGLAGPIYGLGAAIASYALWHATGQPIFAAIAQVGAWINLFNLLPIGPLDGGRAFNALSRKQRWLATAALGAAWFATREGLLLLLLLVAALRAGVDKPPAEGDGKAVGQYLFLVAVLSLMCLIRVPVAGMP